MPDFERMSLILAERGYEAGTPRTIVHYNGPSEASFDEAFAVADGIATPGMTRKRITASETNWGGYSTGLQAVIDFAASEGHELLWVAIGLVLDRVVGKIGRSAPALDRESAIRCATQSIVTACPGVSSEIVHVTGDGVDTAAGTVSVALFDGLNDWDVTVRQSPGGIPFVVSQRRNTRRD